MDTNRNNNRRKAPQTKRNARPEPAPVQKKRPEPTPVRKKPTARRKPDPQKEEEPVRISPDVVYVPPKPFNRNRLILHLATIAAVVAALILGLSVFFQVDTVEVSGNSKYTAEQIEIASGVQKGDHLLTFGRAGVAGRILYEFKYIESVRVRIRLPDTVVIEIVEVDAYYSIQDVSGDWWRISAQGKVLEETNTASDTILRGVKLLSPVAGEQGKAYEDAVPSVDEDGNTIPVTVTAQQRLQTALDIASFLESNGIYGKAQYIDVTKMDDLKLQYEDKFLVELGDTGDLSYKIACLNAAVNQYITSGHGTLDISDPTSIKFLEPKP